MVKEHESKVDVFDFIVLNAFEVSYERLNSNKSSFGVSLFINASSDADYHESFAVTPFYRFYFLSKEDYGAKGYFFELFAKFAKGDYFEDNGNNTSDDLEKYSSFNLGFSVGKKWVHSSGLAVEYSIGVGRNLAASEGVPEMTVRGGVSVGYRF